MSLSQQDLSRRFAKTFTDVQRNVLRVTPAGVQLPLMPIELAQELSKQYHEWASSAIAGGMIPVGGNHSLIASQLSSMPLMSGWAPGLISYWTAVSWNAPTISTGVSIPVALVKISADIVSQFIAPPNPSAFSPQSIDEFADRLATILHSGTLLLQVTQTILQTGATSVVGVS